MANKLDLLRKLIREEVAYAVRTEFKVLLEQELKPILENKLTTSKPTVSTHQTQLKSSLKESVLGSVKPQPKKQIESTGDPIMDMLNETKFAMQPEDYRSIGNFGSQDAQGFRQMMSSQFAPQEPAVVENFNEIVAASRPASSVEAVQLPDAVPDFSALMSSLKAKGAI